LTVVPMPRERDAFQVGLDVGGAVGRALDQEPARRLGEQQVVVARAGDRVRHGYQVEVEADAAAEAHLAAATARPPSDRS
jgi:hypothetical protein